MPRTLAEAARDEGVQLAASPRAARGVRNKGFKQAAYHLRKKGKSTAISKAALEFKKDLQVQKSINQAKAVSLKREMDAYFAEARALRLAALSREGKDQEKLRNAAKELEVFGQALSLQKSMEIAKSKDSHGSSLPNPKTTKNDGGREI